MLSVVRNKTIPYIAARWCRRLSDMLARTMGAMGVPEDFGRFIQAEKNGPPSCAALALEYRFRQQHVHALGAVDDLRHMQVSLRGEQHERVVARQALGLDDEVEHFADR